MNYEKRGCEHMLTEFGKMCRKIRIDNNELLADMAEKVGVSASFLSAIENGKKNIPDSLQNNLVDAYSLDADTALDLKKAAENSVNQIKIEMKSLRQSDRDLVMAFARNFENLDEEDRAKILKLLRK